MRLFSIFRKAEKARPSSPAQPPLQPTANVGAPHNDPGLIRVFDNFGRELFITKEQWRTNVLPGTIQSNWDKPDQLYGTIVSALNDDFFTDVYAAAERLYQIDQNTGRAACLWGIVLMKNRNLDEAENVFCSYIRQRGEDGSILTNLAKVYSARNENQKADQTLWRALEVDPNQANGLGWYWAIQKERDGEEAAYKALDRVAALPGSWRAQLWLARQSLQSRNLEKALTLYQESLFRAGKPVPGDLLMQLSGDLGNQGHLPQLLQLAEPHFTAEIHGLAVGNNLIKAHIDLGQLEAARRILNQLYALKRPDWQPTLSMWDTELAKARLATSELKEHTPNVVMFSIEGPIWLDYSSPAAELVPARPQNETTIAFLGCTAEIATNSQRIQHQLADARGRLSRALPLFLAEQVAFATAARVQTLVPWMAEESGGFILSAGPWGDDTAANYARQGQSKSDYVVTTHLKTQAEPWLAELRLIRTIDGKCLASAERSIVTAKPEDAIPQFAQQLLHLLAENAELESQSFPDAYEVPAGTNLGDYLLRLEQLLSVRCAGMKGVQHGWLSGEREIIDGNIRLCVACLRNVTTRLLLVQTLAAMKKVRPDILPEFREKLALLEKEHPLAESADGVIRILLKNILA
jgi:tetratricopeptide (TPR) repeat protein